MEHNFPGRICCLRPRQISDCFQQPCPMCAPMIDELSCTSGNLRGTLAAATNLYLELSWPSLHTLPSRTPKPINPRTVQPG